MQEPLTAATVQGDGRRQSWRLTAVTSDCEVFTSVIKDWESEDVRVCAEQKLHTPHTQLGNRLRGAITRRAERRVNSRDFGDDRMNIANRYIWTNQCHADRSLACSHRAFGVDCSRVLSADAPDTQSNFFH